MQKPRKTPPKTQSRHAASGGSLDLAAALKSFSGYLQGSGRAEHTIRNYRWDILHFAKYLVSGAEGPAGTPVSTMGQDPLRRLRLADLKRADLEAYHSHLRRLGLKTNTRRRRLITVRRFLAFLVGRKKLPEELGRKFPTPHKIERVPFTVDTRELIAAIRGLPEATPLEARNRALLWILAETGCSVSEIARVKFEDLSADSLQIHGKSARALSVSAELSLAILSLRKGDEGIPWVFRGWNKYRAMPTGITPRGIELLVKAYSEKLFVASPEGGLGGGILTPRTFRHSAVVRWYREGVTREEIQKRLGLKTAYAFRIYEPLFKSSSETTSSGGTPRPES